MSLVLASQSAARIALLKGAGIRFTAIAATIDERAIEARVLGEGAGPEAVAQILAVEKALAVSRESRKAVVIGADQCLALGERPSTSPRT